MRERPGESRQRGAGGQQVKVQMRLGSPECSLQPEWCSNVTVCVSVSFFFVSADVESLRLVSAS